MKVGTLFDNSNQNYIINIDIVNMVDDLSTIRESEL